MTVDQDARSPSFGDLLRRHRLAAGLTQETLAERAGLSARGISDLERGVRTRPYRETVNLLADALLLAGSQRQALLAASRGDELPGARAAEYRQESVTAGQSRPMSLPVPPTPLIGRLAEVTTATTRLRDPFVRLLTLTGAGGSGKTRLAIAIAEQLRTDFPDGVVFVDLAPVTDPTLVPNAIATALGIQEHPGTGLLQTLTRSLTASRCLLILDNFEHLLAAAVVVNELLAVPQLKILVTSRTRLALLSEQELPVLPLAIPDVVRQPCLEHVSDMDAVRLFVTRAQALKPDFALTEENAPAVVEICRRLDGLPLALELAAARIKVLPPQALLGRLERRLPLLRARTRDVPARQQTLREAIAWSYELLTSMEQMLFRRLSVFAGGWRLEAAEAVVDSDGDLDVLDGISSLVDKSLIQSVLPLGDAARLGMLETIREFAQEHLVNSGEEAPMRAAHAAYFRNLGPDAFQQYMVRPTALWQRLAPEVHNLRAALDWAAEQQDNETGLWLAHTLAILARGRGSITEARRWLACFLDAADDRPAIPKARALYDAGRLALFQNDLAGAIEGAERLRLVASELQDETAQDHVRVLGLFIALHQGDLKTARKLADQGMIAVQGAHPASPLTHLAVEEAAVVADAEGDLERAATLWESLLTHNPPDADPGQKAGYLVNLAGVTRRRGDVEKAMRLWIEALAVLRGQWEDTWNIPVALEIAHLATHIGHADLAVRYLAAIVSIRQRSGLVTHYPGETSDANEVMRLAREALDEDAFVAAWANGARTSLQTLADDALRVFEALVQENTR